MKRRRKIVEIHDDFSKLDVVSFVFHEKIDRPDIKIVRHLVVCNEIAKEESFSYGGKELEVSII